LRYPAVFYAASLVVLAVYAAFVWKLAPLPGSTWIMLAVFVAALISSIAGFAFSAICGAMLFHLVDVPLQAVEIMMICSIGGQALMVWSLRREVEWRALLPFLIGGAVGLPLGLHLLLHARPVLFLQAMGGLIVLYGLYMILRRPMTVKRAHPGWDVLAGFLGGITGGAAAFPGGPVTIWCGLKGWSKERQRGLYQPFILILQIAGLVLMALFVEGEGSHRGFSLGGVAYLPAMLLGASFGMTCFKWLSDSQFSRAVNLMLIASGLSLLL
jgi:hypothetical protein